MPHRPALTASDRAPLELRWHAPTSLSDADWARLDAVAAQASDANPFARAALLRSALDAGLGDADPVIAEVVAADGAGVALFALAALPRHGRAPIRTVTSWRHPNGLIPPIAIRAGEEDAAWAALIAALPRRFAAAQLCVPDLPSDSATARGLEAAAAAHRLPLRRHDAHARAMISSTLDPAAYWDGAVRGKKRKELRRQWSRLGELGALAVDLSVERDGPGWIDRFLALEASGWKGAAGSALASAHATRTFCTAAFTAAHDAGRVAVTAITLDRRDVAMLVSLIERNEAFTFKTAYDEAYARFSPGVLIQRESLPRLLGYARTDSLAVADHPMIDSLWSERRAIASYALPLPGIAPRLQFHAAHAATRAWHAAKAWRQSESAHP